jgi:hypothetical protein
MISGSIGYHHSTLGRENKVDTGAVAKQETLLDKPSTQY